MTLPPYHKNTPSSTFQPYTCTKNFTEQKHKNISVNARLGPEALAELKEETPLLRLGTPEDVAKAAVYLSEAEFVTGQVLGVNGGFIL